MPPPRGHNKKLISIKPFRCQLYFRSTLNRRNCAHNLIRFRHFDSFSENSSHNRDAAYFIAGHFLLKRALLPLNAENCIKIVLQTLTLYVVESSDHSSPVNIVVAYGSILDTYRVSLNCRNFVKIAQRSRSYTRRNN